MNGKSFQFHVYNEHINFIVSVPYDMREYADDFASRVAVDFYGYTEKQVENVNVEFICKYTIESAINLNMMKK